MSLQKTLVAAAAALAVTGSAHAVTFDLGSVPAGTNPTFTITAGGVSETYTSPAGNQFTTENTSGLLDFSPALADFNFFSTDALTISFSTPQYNRILIPFAIFDAYDQNGNDSLSVTTNTGQTLIFGTTVSGLPTGEPTGVVKFVPTTPVTSLTLSSANPNNSFAVGSTDVPEPVSLSLLGVGLVGLAASRRRAR